MRHADSPRTLRSASALGATLVLALVGRGASADEIIDDPELTGGRPAPATSSAPGPVAPSQGTPAPAAPSVASVPPASAPADVSMRVVLHSRVGVDTTWDRAAQDILEGTTIGLVEAQYRKTESLLFSVGLRARHAYGMRHDGDTRYELDVVPVSGYADAAVGRSVHLRVGYQVISMGRFDVFSASNFLGVYDLRSGLVSMPDAIDVAQPAVRLDWDPSTSSTIQAYYVPFFTPDILPVYGTNYSLLERVVPVSTNPGALEKAVGGRSALASGSTQALRALAPRPDFTTPQGAVRATTRGSAGEGSLTFGTALERIPVLRWTSADPTKAELRADYGRFYVVSADGALDAGPFQLGAEVAFLGHRTLGTVVTQNPVAFGASGHTNLVHAAVRAELVQSAGFVSEVEVFGQYALNRPSDPSTQWFAMEEGRYWKGMAAGMQYSPDGSPFRLEFAGAVVSGPTLVLMPRVQYELTKGLYSELGAAFVEGPAPSAQSPMVSLGGIFSDVDQVFLGLRWVP